MKVLVLGCGPTGLLATHAAHYAEDVSVTVVSIKRKSELFGCQYLHGPIPGMTLDTTTVTYELAGSASEYREKVYGPGAQVKVSPESLTGQHPAWDIRHAYNRLWQLYQGLIVDADLNAHEVQPMLDYYRPDLVVSSIPAPALCQKPGEHAFTNVGCWAMGDAPERGQFVPVPVPENTVLCNGTRDTGWYRVSNVFGYKTAEWSGLRSKPPLSGIAQFFKPLDTTCDCWPEFLRVGRFGVWRKGILSHTAFNDTIAALAAGRITSSA